MLMGSPQSAETKTTTTSDSLSVQVISLPTTWVLSLSSSSHWLLMFYINGICVVDLTLL